MSSRHQEILKLAQETLTDGERSRLNTALTIAHGFDFIDSVLEERGFSRGTRLSKDTYLLMRGNEQIGNAILSGDYQRMKVLPKQVEVETKPSPSSKPKRHYVPADAYTSPAALYERWEREQEDKD
jgi:hypothetical protein